MPHLSSDDQHSGLGHEQMAPSVGTRHERSHYTHSERRTPSGPSHQRSYHDPPARSLRSHRGNYFTPAVEAEIQLQVRERMRRCNMQPSRDKHRQHPPPDEGQSSVSIMCERPPRPPAPNARGVPANHADPNEFLIKEVAKLKVLVVNTAQPSKQGRAVIANTLLAYTDRLNSVPCPQDFIQPICPPYDGYGDPQRHLDAFGSHMMCKTREYDVYALAFPASLKGDALKWFGQLPKKSIDSYQEFADQFVAKFGASIKMEPDEQSLMELSQKPRESLRDYAKRYDAIINSIPAVSDSVAIIAFYHGLQLGPLKDNLVLDKARTRMELSARIMKYIQLEEMKRNYGGDLRNTVLHKEQPRSPKNEFGSVYSGTGIPSAITPSHLRNVARGLSQHTPC